MTTLYLVRHCEAAGNIGRTFQGSMDKDISENGARQLEHLAQRFRTIPLDALYASPLLRARKTAEAMNRFHALPILLDERLCEINGGAWEGQPWAELPKRFPEESACWLNEPWRFWPPQGEPMTAVYARMAAALTDIAKAQEGRTVAVASHGCAIRNALCWAKGLPLERLNDVAWCDNTAVSVLEWDGKAMHVRMENDNSHLDDTLSTFAKQTWWKDAENPFQ